MHRWMAAFPNPTHLDGEDNEVIYEDWGENRRDAPTGLLLIHSLSFFFFGSDCPQVQCVEQYVAQQTDELSLEPTEIVNVIRKTNEGKNVGDVTFRDLTLSIQCNY